MSYPRVLQTLLIEDETSVVETYREYFKRFEEEGLPVAPPRVAQSLKDAQTELDRDRIIHTVILDLRLPDDAGGASEEASSRGLELLGRISTRETYPVPVLLIVTGDLRRANPFESLRRQLEEGFSYGRILAKGLDLAAEIRAGLDAALRYCDIGVHLSGGAGDLYPPISPREDDLLRRCALEEEAVGVDLRWWAANRRDRGSDERPDWAKVLQGRFLLPGDAGVSRPRFFKFESRENGERSKAGAIGLAHKVNHIKVVRSLRASDHHLLVTDKAGPSNSEPLSLRTFLAGPASDVAPRLPRLASEIGGQLRLLGDETTEELRSSKLFWPHHDADRIAHACHGADLEGDGPSELFRRLQETDALHWCVVRTRHGDLHLDNISLDPDEPVHSYLIDPGAMARGVAARDFATLEVSLLLHQRYTPTGPSLVSTCRDLYDGSCPDRSADVASASSDHNANTREFVRQLRIHALQGCSAPGLTYPLLLLDEVLIQIGGLAFGTSQNKIYRDADAIELFRYVRDWLTSSLPNRVG
ncbi:MAG: hypothetical protein ABIT01_05630 [Thermoanaerobaculia bacterium]